MPDTKISGLTALTGANTDRALDLIPIVDTSAVQTKSISPAEFLKIASQNLSYILAQSAVAVSGAEDTAENTLATITIPANALGANGSIAIITSWTFTNSANLKTLRARFSGGAGSIYMSFAITTQATTQAQFIISNRNSASSQVGGTTGGNATGGWGVSTGAIVTSAIDTTAQTTIVITGQKALGTETITLERYIAILSYGV